MLSLVPDLASLVDSFLFEPEVGSFLYTHATLHLERSEAVLTSVFHQKLNNGKGLVDSLPLEGWRLEL